MKSTTIEISHEIPPIYERLNQKFGVKWDDEVIIASQGKIYCKTNPTPQKVIHEKVHLDAQGKIGEHVWWDCYLSSDEFRLNEEKKAYFAEAQFIKKYIKDREARFHLINDIATSFSSSMYGTIISKQDALTLLL